MRRTETMIAFAFLVVLLLGASEAFAWWNISYSKRMPINFTPSIARNNTPLCINITYDADMQTAFGDLRFSNASTTEYEYSYWLESYSASSWGKVCLKGNFTTGNKIQAYMYYGNGGATSNSSGNNTFTTNTGGGKNFYSFTGNASDMWGTYAGTVSGCTLTTDIFGKAYNAYSFNSAATNYISTGDNDNFRNNFTFVFWIKPSSLPGGGSTFDMISKQTDASRQFRTNIQSTGGIEVGLSTSCAGSSYSTVVATGIAANSWNQLAITRQDNGSVKVYNNGTLLSTQNVLSGTLCDNAIGLDIGRYGGAAGAGDRYFNGTIDDIMMFDRVLSDSEIQNLFMPNYTYAFGAEESAVSMLLNITSPSTTTYHNYTIPLNYTISGFNASYICNHSIDTNYSSNYWVSNNTAYTADLLVANGTHTLQVNCSANGSSTTGSVAFTQDIGKLILNMWDEATSNYTNASRSTILVYNSSANMNFTGNNFTWGYTEIPGGNITIIGFYNNITRETSVISNSTNYQNITLSFPSLTGNYYFLIHNIYNNPIENALVSFYELDGSLITQRYSQSDGYVYDIFLTMNIPVTIQLSKNGYITKILTFTPYIDTILPVKIKMDEFLGNGTEYIPFANVSYSCNPNQLIVDNNTLITCTLQESNSQLLTTIMRVYYVNYSGSFLSKTTTCVNPGSCTFTFTTNKTGSRFRLNLTMNMSYGNYTKERDYVTNATGSVDLPSSTDLGIGVWQFIFFVIMLIILAITWGYFGALSLLTIPVIIGIGVLYGVFNVGQLILLLIVVFILFMKIV